MAEKNFKAELNKELGTLEEEFIILLNTNSEYYFDSVLETLKVLTDKGMGGVYLTSARPYDYIIGRLEKHNIDTKNLLFIDTISCMAGKSAGEQGNCVYIENPSALEEVGMWTNTLMERIEMENKILIVDSLSTMQIYNDIGALKQFSQFLINRLRLKEESGVFASIEMEKNNRFYETLVGMCDKTINV